MSGSNLNTDFLPYFETDDVVIVAPLSWGLGHASRCIPLIELLQSHCKKVILASDGLALTLLQEAFPDLETIILPSYNIRYYYADIAWNILRSSLSILNAVSIENKIATAEAKNHKATVIISDNRLGFRSKFTRNYYLSHQLNIWHKVRFLRWFGSVCHQWCIRQYDLIFVPDYGDDRAICPKLSRSDDQKVKYLGPISRVKMKALLVQHDICVIISGPEPQRTMLEHALWEICKNLNSYSIIFVRGTKNKAIFSHIPPHIVCKDMLHATEIEYHLNSSKLLISRSGYSTIMDVYRLPIKAIFIPTPGQSEQEYLAESISKNDKYKILNQNDINKLEKTINCLI